MTAQELQKRNERAQQLKVLQSDEGQYFVESAEGKILYNVVFTDEETSCTCGDFARSIKKDKNFLCKHIISVMNAIPKKKFENAKFLEKQIAKLDDRFLTNIKGKDFVLYAGVLDLATQKGLLKLEVELLQYPSKENGYEAICRAVATGKTGEVFSDIGDANPNNCHSMIAKHLIRMASTRAKGRCLRDMCNIGIACLEELSDFNDVIGNGAPQKTTGKKTSSKASTKASKPKEEKKQAVPKNKPKTEKKQAAKSSTKTEPETSKQADQSTVPQMSEAQKRAIFNLSRRRGISIEELNEKSAEAYGTDVESLTQKDASKFIRTLQAA